MTASASFSVVLPFFNEEQNVETICLELKDALAACLSGSEIILVDNGSTDSTGKKLAGLPVIWPECHVYHLPANQGESTAFLFGFAKTTAPVIVTMGGDGQYDPRDIPKLLARLDQADMVVGVRVERQDSWIRRKISRTANVVRAKCLGDAVSDAGCVLKAFRREVVHAFIPIRTLNFFMPALAVASGFRVVEEPVHHRPGRRGPVGYTIASLGILLVVDFIALWWFRFRRCPAPATHPPIMETLGDELYRRAFRRWNRSLVLAALVVLGFSMVLLSLRSEARAGSTKRRISLARAERIALRRVPDGRLGTEEMRISDGRPTWSIDVWLPSSPNLDEIYIDGVDGHVIAVRAETAAEEELETSVEEHRFNSKRRVPR
ncbi:MAG: glycosyltransferase [Chthoniobacterales bacterium]